MGTLIYFFENFKKKGRWYKWGTLIYFFENFKSKKDINFRNIKLIFDSIFYKESKVFTFARISRKNYFLKPLLKGRWYKGGTLIYFFENFKRKKNIHFQNIKHIFDSIIYKESKEFTLARISRKKLLYEPSVWIEDYTKVGNAKASSPKYGRWMKF